MSIVILRLPLGSRGFTWIFDRALSKEDYTKKLAQTAFNQIEPCGLSPGRMRGLSSPVVDRPAKEVEGNFVIAFVRATKPATVLFAWLPQNND
jgi:hypothetical protein